MSKSEVGLEAAEVTEVAEAAILKTVIWVWTIKQLLFRIKSYV